MLAQAYSKSILSLVTPNPSWPQPYLLWLRRASYAAPSGRRPPPTLHFVDNAGVASVGRLVLHASVHFRSFKIFSQEQHAHRAGSHLGLRPQRRERRLGKLQPRVG